MLRKFAGVNSRPVHLAAFLRRLRRSRAVKYSRDQDDETSWINLEQVRDELGDAAADALRPHFIHRDFFGVPTIELGALIDLLALVDKEDPL
jgi:hypothetical protein